MSPEFILIYNNQVEGEINFNPEKSDIFSLGITYLRVIYPINEIIIKGLNEIKNQHIKILFILKV